MAIINGSNGNPANVDSNGSIQIGLYGSGGTSVPKTKGAIYAGSHEFLPISGLNDGIHRPIRMDRFGGLASIKYTPVLEYSLFTAALPPTWLNTAASMSTTHSISIGTLLNASSIGTANTNSILVSMQTTPKTQRSPIFQRVRARLVKGGTNGVAEIGMITTQTPGSLQIPNGFIFQYAVDGTLTPVVVFNNNIVSSGNDFASMIDSTRYYTWDIYSDDNSVTFMVQDSTTGQMITEQTLNIGSEAGRLASLPYFFSMARTYVGATANIGVATQIYIGDISSGILDVDTGKSWNHIMAGAGKGVVVNPTTALTQLENYANSVAPVSATLSNTTAGYTTLGGQFQFAAVNGSEADFCLFAFTVPVGVKLNVTDIFIDTMVMGAAVASTPTTIQWFAGVDDTAITLASNTFRKSLGIRSLPIGSVVGTTADTITRNFQTPLVTNSGRVFHIGFKAPVSTATASQIIRGVVSIGGYFE